MIRRLSDKLRDAKTHGPTNDINGAYCLKRGNAFIVVVASNGLGWDHVSASLKTRCPTWEEMNFIKDEFFDPEEVVVQIHARRSAYVNNHNFCLHLWRPQTAEEISSIRAEWGDEWQYGNVSSPGTIPEPPAHLVGYKQLGRIN